MDVAEIQRQYVSFGNSMYREGHLDEQFIQVQKLADETHPSFAMEVIAGFLNESDKILEDLNNAIEMQNFSQAMELCFALKGSTSSIGVKKVKTLFVVLIKYCEEKNLQRCSTCMDEVKEEYATVKRKLETHLKMQQEIMAAGGVIPLLE